MHVLLVEDDALVASGIAAGLRLHDATVDHVETAQAGRSAFQTAHFDLAILDLGLPDEDGMSLLHGLRKAGVAIPILVLTARDALGDRVAGLRAGADDYLLKPFELDELALLQALLHHPGRVLTLAQVRDCLYGFEGNVESNAVNVHVHHLRRKLGSRIVETVRGIGYRLGEAGT